MVNTKISKLIAMGLLSLSFISCLNTTSFAEEKNLSTEEFKKLSLSEMYDYVGYSQEVRDELNAKYSESEIKENLISSYFEVSHDSNKTTEEKVPNDGDERNLKVGFTATNLGYVYCKDDTLKKVNGWVSIDNSWYHFTNFIMDKGWLKDGNSWYFLDTHSRTVDGAGKMKTGWLQDNNKWYFLKNNGAMMSNGWLKINGKWYYFNSNGTMKTGWLKDGGSWYFLYSDGHMAANTTINGYKLNSSGAWIN